LKKPDLLLDQTLTPEDIVFLEKLHRDIEITLEKHSTTS
jgi:hypothetical protein